MSLKTLLIVVTWFAVAMACYGWWLRIPEPFKDNAGLLCWMTGWLWVLCVPLVAFIHRHCRIMLSDLEKRERPTDVRSRS